MAESSNFCASPIIRRGEKGKGYPKKDDLMATLVKARKSPYRNLLLRKRQELLASTKNAPEALATSLQTPDEVEFAIRTAQQDLTATTAELRSQMLKEVEGALKRVAGGTYGFCEGCGEEISPNRLKAIPWARYCLTCQELRSKN
jgi:DnaK suppressor protein